MDEKANGVATAGDFRKLAEDNVFEPPERVVLPKSGLAVMLRRPRPVAFTLLGQSLPASLATKERPLSTTRDDVGPGLAVADPRVGPTSAKADTRPGQAPGLQPEELAALSRLWVEIFKRMFVAPRLSLTPAPDEIHPDWIASEDVTFLIRWAVGEVASDGADLASFRRGPGPDVAPR